MNRQLLWLAMAMIFINGPGCADSDGDREPGTERGPCYANGSCNAGLVCASDLCVKPSWFDTGLPDQGVDGAPDVRIDAPAPDLAGTDLPVTDASAPDIPTDALAPDQTGPDLALDQVAPDAPVPDIPRDALAPDQTGPDLALDQGAPDQTSNVDAGGPTPGWTISIPSPYPPSGTELVTRSIAVDGLGNSYITGYFKGVVTLGSTTLTSKGWSAGAGMNFNDIFVAKIDGSGKFMWTVSGGGIWDDYALSIGVDGSGNCYVAGDFSKTMTIGGKTLTAADGSTDIFVARIDGAGKVIWAVSAGGKYVDYEPSIAVDGSGNSHITGHFIGTAMFGSTTLIGGTMETFVARLDSSGKFLWAYDLGISTYQSPRSIAVDSMGNSYIASNFITYATPGSLSFKAKGSTDIFVGKMDSGGKLLWGVAAGGPLADKVYSLAVDTSGNSHVTGSFTGTATFGSTTLTSKKLYYEKSDLFAFKLDSAGKYLWTVSAGGTDDDIGNSIAVDSSGNSYITGLLGPTTFGGATLTTSGALVVKVDGGGKFVSSVSSPNTPKYGQYPQQYLAMDSSSIYIATPYMVAKLGKF